MNPSPSRRVLFEVCAGSVGAVEAAAEACADRVELCTALEVGGVTPSIGMVRTAVELAAGRLLVHVLVRPREGDFVFSHREVDAMCRDIEAAKSAGADGLVIGALRGDGSVDVEVCRRLVDLARPASVTFHRAFDVTADPLSAFEQVKALGVDRLLTSGAARTALAGRAFLAELVRRSEGALRVLPGGGVTEDNAEEVLRASGASELHFSGRAGLGGTGQQPLAERLSKIMARVLAAPSGHGGSARARL